jgi:hypothetical protein
MKKQFVAIFILICSLNTYSQQWFEAGVKGGYGVSFLANSNLFNDHSFSPQISFGYMYGGKIGFNFNENHAITVDVTTGSIEQKYNYGHLNPDSSKTIYNRSIGFDALNILLMYRKAGDGGYFEIGPQLSTITKTRGSDGFTQTKNVDISANLAKSYYSAVVGFGGYILGSDDFRLILGFRASYAFTDVLSSAGRQSSFPSTTHYTNYKAINPVTGMMLMELNFDVGYFARSRCKKRKLSFLLFSK